MGAGAVVAILIPLIPLLAILALWVGSLYDPKLQNILYKLHLVRVGLQHMLFSTDKRWNAKKFPDSDGLEVEEEKHVIFIRHAESAWNLVFNKGFGSDFPGRLRDAVVKEVKLGNTLDSVFMDSPLSKIGTDQAEALQEFMETGEEKLSELLRGKEGDSILCSSNLRRALSTLTIGMWERLKRTQEKIHVLSSLQEITFNVDGVSLAKPGLAPQLSDTELNALYAGGDTSKFDPDRYYDCTFNGGNKPVFTTGIDRMQQFCAWCFEQEAATIIAGGHSLYNRFFFKTFMPKSSSHVSKVKKMQNCSIVSMTLKKGKKNNRTWYAIDEDSVEVVYLGFEEKSKKKKKTA